MWWTREYAAQLGTLTPEERERVQRLRERIAHGAYAQDRDDTPLLRRLRFYRWLFISGRMRDY